MEEPGQTPDKNPHGPRSRAPLIFAVVGVCIALVATGAYFLREGNAPPRLSPEETVREFLSAVFVAGDADRVAAVVCQDWDPGDAISRTNAEIESGGHVSWDDIRVLTEEEDRISAGARLGIRLPDDRQPSYYRQWRFNLVDEHGWRVCEARPFIL